MHVLTSVRLHLCVYKNPPSLRKKMDHFTMYKQYPHAFLGSSVWYGLCPLGVILNSSKQNIHLVAARETGVLILINWIDSRWQHGVLQNGSL